jgi:hypothetical protein
MFKERRLQDLVSIGPAMIRDFEILGIHSVAQLAARDPQLLYEELCGLTGRRQDICCLDVFRAAVAQARNPWLPDEQCQWWYWSRKRKAESEFK